MEQNLKSQWVSVCNGVVVAQAEDATLKWWEYIATRYNEKQRHYHTLQHIHDMLVDAAAYKHLLKSPKDVALAIFFHEYVVCECMPCVGACFLIILVLQQSYCSNETHSHSKPTMQQ